MLLIRALLTFAALAIVASPVRARTEGCSDQAVQAATTPSEKKPSNRYTRQVAQIQRTRATPTVLLFGDSLIERWQPFIAEQVPDVRVANLGVSGDQTQHTLWRLDRLRLDLDDPAFIVLLIGTNNLSKRAQPCAIASGVLQVASKLGQRWPTSRVLVFSIPPRGKKYASYDEQRSEANGLVSAGLKNQPNAEFVQIDDNEFRCGPPSDRPCGNFDKDRLHLAKDGYAILAALVNKHLKNNSAAR